MRINLLLLLVVITTLVKAQESRMNASEIEAFKTMVEKTSQATKTITSNFVQYKHLDFLDNDIETS